jgi:hypothetical protein
VRRCQLSFETLRPIAFCLLDIDLYQPTRDVLPHLYDALAPGGMIVVDDCPLLWRLCPNARVRPRVVPAPAVIPPPAETASCPLATEPVRPRPTRRPIPWAELLRRTFQTDVLNCPRCGGTRRVVAVVLRSATAQAILEHLRLPSRPLPVAPATSPPQLGFW